MNAYIVLLIRMKVVANDERRVCPRLICAGKFSLFPSSSFGLRLFSDTSNLFGHLTASAHISVIFDR